MQAFNQDTILQEWETIRSKKYKPSALFYRVRDSLARKKVWMGLSDLYLIAQLCDYKVLWVYEQYNKIENLVIDCQDEPIPEFDLPF